MKDDDTGKGGVMEETKTMTTCTYCGTVHSYSADMCRDLVRDAALTALRKELEEANRKCKTPADFLREVDREDEEAFEAAMKANDEYVGSLEYQGNTVSYIASKAENYGNQLGLAHRNSGAPVGVSVVEYVKTLQAKLSEAERERDDLASELALNASMLAEQCDLARVAEMEWMRFKKLWVESESKFHHVGGQKMLDRLNYLNEQEPKLIQRAEKAEARVKELEAENARLLNEPIHLGFLYNSEAGITNLYVLDENGEETDREVKAECLLRKISEYFYRAIAAEEELAKVNFRKSLLAEISKAEEDIHDR